MNRAGFLPGVEQSDVAWRRLTFGTAHQRIDIEVPQLTPAQLAMLAQRVRTAGFAYLRQLPLAQIIATIDEAVAKLLERNNPYRREADALLPAITGYDAQMVRLGLTQYLKTFRAPQLRKFVAEDFSDPLVLDHFQPMRKGGYARAYGPALLLQIWAGNVPALSLWSLVCALLVKAPSIGKLASAEPLFAGLFARLLADIDPKLGECLAVVWWEGGDEAREAALLERADVVLAYGGNASLESLRARTPITTRCLAYGHKVSFGVVTRSALKPDKAWSVAHDAAYDIIRYDQQGCYSPHVFFVERGGRVSPREMAAYLASELAAFEKKYPRRALSMSESGALAAWRNTEQTRALTATGRAVVADELGAWAVSFTDSLEALSASALDRTVKVIAVERWTDVLEQVAPFRAVLQTVGVAASPEELFDMAEAFGRTGVTRISAVGHMTAPEAGWHHDGRFNLLDLVTITEVESSAESAAESFASYVD
ncbi:MAG: acyl-CoA reductase [Gammaproteobacteria bacterium]|nr:acyl-CoA reductase [Gammaproteobacteria bacterium]